MPAVSTVETVTLETNSSRRDQNIAIGTCFFCCFFCVCLGMGEANIADEASGIAMCDRAERKNARA